MTEPTTTITEDPSDTVTPPPSSTTTPSPPPEWKPTRNFYLAFTALCILCLAMAFDASVLSIALSTISADLGGTAIEAFWSVTSFLLASAVFQPTVAALSDIFGRAYLVYVTCFFFGAGSLMGGLAGNFAVLIAARVLQGVGAGGLMALSEVIVTDLVPLAHRGYWLSLISVFWAIGSVAGPIIGAAFTQKVSWRWVFYINLPPITIGFILIFFFLKQAKIPGGVLQKLSRFDWIGSAIFIASSGSFLFGLTAGGVMYAWTSAAVVASIVLGAVGLVAFGVYDLYYAREPIMHPGLFNNRDMVICYVLATLNGAILWTVVYFMILYYQAVQIYSPVLSSVAALPETLTVAPGAAIVGIVAGKTGHYRWAVWASWVLTTLGCGLLYVCDPFTSVPAWIFLNLPVGLGTGMAITALTLAIQAACKPELNGAAAAFNPFLRTFGQALGISISGVTLQNAFRRELGKIPGFSVEVAREYSREATAIVEVIHGMADGEERIALQWAYLRSLRVIWIVMIVLSGVGTLLSFGIRGYSLNQEHVSKQKLETEASVSTSGEIATGTRAEKS